MQWILQNATDRTAAPEIDVCPGCTRGGGAEIRNPKVEIRKKAEIRKAKTENRPDFRSGLLFAA
jgi:hypothetical protein